MNTIDENIRQMLIALGEDPSREGLVETPERVRRSMQELTSGYGVAASDVISGAIFETTSTDVIVQKNIEFFSLCEHHLLPFFGKVHIAYTPNGKIIGLSKMGRIIDVFARRLQVQEHLCEQIADALFECLSPKGLAVLIEAQHFCMMMRGVKKQHGITLTRALRGDFASSAESRMEITSLLTLSSRPLE